ncbi:MAG TPA: hypothetical protein VMZ53_09450 [Kofleriaceae bacterium]|nr:hypothetical protein [Kofleriaceae bacterium]
MALDGILADFLSDCDHLFRMEVRMRSMYLAAACVSLIACTVDAPDTSVTNQEIRTRNRLASNRLASNRLASNRLASNRLASNSLSSTILLANPETNDLMLTEEGRDLYSYIVGCALPEGITIEGNVPGAPNAAPPDFNYTCSGGHCVFSGALGLAPRWAEHKLDNKGQGWVSACLLSRVNANGIAEGISMRGRNDELAVSGDELVLFPAEEGAFYGNVFEDVPAENDDAWLALTTNACSGEDNFVAHDQARDCATPNPATDNTLTYCGFHYAGDCRDFTPAFPNPYACRGFSGSPDGYYMDCHRDAGGKGKKSREVITTYVAQ